MSTIFLIPGLGADSRIYKNLYFNGRAVISINWFEPEKTDTLENYAQKIINQYHINENSIVIGNSLGGMLAVEIAKKVALDKVIIISSIKTVNEAPAYFSFFRNAPIYKIIPDKLFTSIGFFAELIFGEMEKTDKLLFKDMLKRSSTSFLKWAMNAILQWNNKTIPKNIYHITGDKDLVFSYKRIKGAIIVKGGTHIMIFDKAQEINKILKGIFEMKLPPSYYLNHNVVEISRDLLGKYLFTSIDNVTTGGYIVEAEAYNGIIDKASHAFGNRNTNRTKTMYLAGGIAYVYLCYGIHEMFNIVTSVEGQPHAILVRAIQPTDGLDVMMARRNMTTLKPNLTAGPGSVAKALGISRAINAFSLQGNTIWIEDRGLSFPDESIAVVPRIGVAYAGEDALLPYRFYVKRNPYVSKPNK